jgi:hypothetical protein
VQCATEIEEYTLDNNIFKENYLECIVEFAYTGKVRIDSEIVQDLLVAASFLHWYVMVKNIKIHIFQQHFEITDRQFPECTILF